MITAAEAQALVDALGLTKADLERADKTIRAAAAGGQHEARCMTQGNEWKLVDALKGQGFTVVKGSGYVLAFW